MTTTNDDSDYINLDYYVDSYSFDYIQVGSLILSVPISTLPSSKRLGEDATFGVNLDSGLSFYLLSPPLDYSIFGNGDGNDIKVTQQPEILTGRDTFLVDIPRIDLSVPESLDNVGLTPLPDAVPGQVCYLSPVVYTPIIVNEQFSLNDYDVDWKDDSVDPDGVGSQLFEQTDLKILWGDIPYAYKKTIPQTGGFGGTDSFGKEGYLKNVVLYVGAAGVLDQELATPFPAEVNDPREGVYKPDVVYFGIQVIGVNPLQSIYLIIAHTELPTTFTSGDVISGPTTNVKMILAPAEASFVHLEEYNTFLGGGVTNVLMVGPSGIGEDGDFDPIVFANTPSALSFPDDDVTLTDTWGLVYDETNFHSLDESGTTTPILYDKSLTYIESFTPDAILDRKPFCYLDGYIFSFQFDSLVKYDLEWNYITEVPMSTFGYYGRANGIISDGSNIHVFDYSHDTDWIISSNLTYVSEQAYTAESSVKYGCYHEGYFYYYNNYSEICQMTPDLTTITVSTASLGPVNGIASAGGFLWVNSNNTVYKLTPALLGFTV